MILNVEKLDVFIGSTQILRNVSFWMNEGEIICLLGRNGAGKSSLLKSIVGLYPCRSGKIFFRGNEITSFCSRKRILFGIGYSPGDARVFPDLTVEENILLSTWIRNRKVKDVIFNFEKIFTIFPRIKTLLTRKGLNLSGGEKKMVSI